MSRSSFRLIGQCPDKPGIVAQVAGFIAQLGGSITQASQYQDEDTARFFMRYLIDPDSLDISADEFRVAFEPLGHKLQMQWQLFDASQPKRVVVLVSKLDHCLVDLLHRWKSRELDFDLVSVISNHDDLREVVQWHGAVYHHIPVPTQPDEKQAAFEKTGHTIAQADPDVIVLARYMQILPPWLCDDYPNQIINIHHSFLPSFVGARPYHQAHQRGVKLIGATCHYVTQDLDAGPIIEQDVIRIGHDNPIEELVRLGRDVEKTVLSRGLRYHLEDRVLVQGNKTVLLG